MKITQEELNERIEKNVEMYGDKIDDVVYKIKEKKLNKGRMRPRDPDKQRILDRFKRK